MEITPDAVVYWSWGPAKLNATIVFTWAVMAALFVVSRLATRKLTSGEDIGRWQNLLESVVSGMLGQIEEVTHRPPDRFLPFLGTLFLFSVSSNLLSAVPWFQPPTGSLSTTAALALCVFVAVPFWGVADRGVLGYLREYVRPTPVMLPFNIIGEVSRTLALAVRLFGNIMSGSMIAAILLAVAPMVFPVVMNLLGLLTGVVQAYIFAILAAVYIASALRAHEDVEKKREGVREPSPTEEPVKE